MALNSTNDCFAQFDEAFARLEADLATPDERSSTPSADLSEYEEAFDNIDRQLAAQPEPTTPETPTSEPMPAPAPAVTPEPLADGVIKPTRVSLALVPPTAVAESSRTTALVQHETETLWERPANGGTPLERLVGTMQNLLWLQRAIHARSPRIVDRVRWQQVADVFNDVRQLCTEFDLQTARVRAEFALKALDDDRLDGLAAEIGELVRHIRHDLQTCSIVPIARESVWGFTLALDARAQRAFPSAVREVADAGRCIGFTTHAAAAFHLMRAAEIGRRAVARAIRFDTRETEAADWAGTITALQARMLDLSGWPAGPARKAVKNFLTALLSDAREMEEARRRLAEGEPFMECHAVALWYSTRDFLALAAERVSETEDTLLTADDFVGSEVTGNG